MKKINLPIITLIIFLIGIISVCYADTYTIEVTVHSNVPGPHNGVVNACFNGEAWLGQQSYDGDPGPYYFRSDDPGSYGAATAYATDWEYGDIESEPLEGFEVEIYLYIDSAEDWPPEGWN